MAKGNSSRGSADGSPSSLTTLLALPVPEAIAPTPQINPYAEMQAFAVQESLRLHKAKLEGKLHRGYVPEWDDPKPWHHGLKSFHPQSDRRRYDPTKRSRPPHATIRSATHLHIGSVGTPYGRLSASVRFGEPRQVDLCIRRHTRRSVLFALNRTAKGSGQKTRRRNFFSDVKC